MRKVFEIDPVLCPSCGGQMRPVAIITQDCELDRGGEGRFFEAG